MLTHLTSTPQPTLVKTRARKKRTLTAAMLSGALLLSACQEQNAPVESTDTQGESVKRDAPVTPSDSAAARIEAFQPRYVMQKQALQRRLQAEYESLQAADATAAQTSTDIIDPAATATTDATAPTAGTAADTESTEANVNSTDDADTAEPNATAQDSSATSPVEDINTSIEAGERDLAVLQKVTLEPRAPEQLDETDIIKQYQDAMQALYASESRALTATQMDTLLNIASLVPGLFEHTEIADRLVLKSPALARLVVQHQVWQQIEAQQAIDMQNIKQSQQAEFEALVEKFNSTMKDYDEQIAKYEQTLESYQQE